MEEIRCCTRETCPAYRKTSNSQDEASAPSEYTNFCDCFSDTPRKRCRNRHFSMRDVYKNMENPEQFRETLSDMNIMTGNLLKCLKAAAGDGKLNERSQWCLQNVCNKIPSSSTEVSLAQVTTLAERFLRSLGEPSSPDRNKQRSRVLYRNCCQKRGDKLSSNSLEFVVPVKISLGNKKAKAGIQFPRKKLKKKRVDTRYCSCDEEEREIDIFHSCESFAPQTIQLQQLQETEAQATKLRALRKFESQAQKKRGLKKLETQEAQQYALKKIETQAVQPAELTKDQAQTTDEMFYSCQSFSSEIFCRVCHQSPCICEVPAICKLCCKKTNLCKCERIDTSHILLAVQSTSVCRLCKKSPGKCRCSKKKGYSKDPSIPLVSTQLLRSSDDICQIKPDMSQKLYQRICFKCGLKHDKCVCCLPRVINTCKICGKPIYKCVCEKPQTSGFAKSEPQCLLPTKEMGTKCLELLPVVNFCKKCGIVSDRCLCKSDFARKKEVDIPVTNDAFADHIFDNMIRSCSCRKQGQINPDLIAELCLICRKTSDQSEKSMLAASNTEFIPEICSCEKLLIHDLNFPSKICKKCSTPLHQGVSEKYEECMIDSTALFIPDVCSCEKLLQHDLESVPKICKVCWCELQKCGCERPHISKAPSATTSGNPCDICGLSRSKCSCGKASSIPKPFCKCDAKGTDLCTCEQVREICCLFGENKDICECGKTVLSTTPSKIAQAQKICQQCGMPLRKCPCKHAMQCKAILPPKTVLTADKANETSFLEIDSVSTIQDTKMTAEKASGTVFEEMGSASTLEEMYPPSKLKKTKPTPECKGESISVGQLINKVEMANRDEIPSRGATTGEGKMAIEYEMRKREEVSNKDEKATEGAVSSKGEISNKIENSKNGVISIEDEIIDGKIASKVGVTSKAEIPSNAEIPSKGEILRRRESPENELANEVKIPREDKEPIVHEMSSGAEIAKPVGKPSMEELPGKIERHPERGMRSLSQHPDICIWDIDPEGKQEPCKCGREHIDLEDLEDFEKSLAYNKDQESYETDHGRCACNIPKLSIKPAPPPKPPRKTYRLAFPQHKDLDICRKCRFEPSPLIDQDGRVFCPGNCGCCLCPWRPRATPSMEDALRHSKFKVCKCRERGTIFTEFAKIDSDCSQISYFDACPCREKAEAIHLRLYGFEMWDVNDTLLEKFRGNVVYLKDVKENVPLKGQSKKFFSSALYNEQNEKK